MAKERDLTFVGHLQELRVRILRISAVILVATIVIYAHTDKIMRVIARPGGHLIFTEPTEAFVTYLKVAFWSALFVCSPYVIVEVWQFVAEAVSVRHRKYVLMALPVSFLLFIVGVWFGFAFVVTAGLQFLLNFGREYMTPMLSVGHYVSFVASMCLSFGIVFQLPVIIGLLTKIGVVAPSFLIDKRRYASVLIFVVAGILTPSPDIFSQICMAVPLLVLYELSILVSAWIYARNKRFSVQLQPQG